MEKWERMLVQTDRGQFEVFIKGEGEPLCVSHQYSVFNESGDYFADTFTENHRVYLINLREAGSSAKAEQPYQLSFLETVFDLEAIREALQMDKWFFAGHSTGGMIGLMYVSLAVAPHSIIISICFQPRHRLDQHSFQLHQ